MTSPKLIEYADKAELRARIVELEKALGNSQQFLIAWLPEYPVGHVQRKRVMDQLDANTRALRKDQ